MSNCVLSSQNRFYVEKESTYGQVPTIGAGNRISAISLGVTQRRDVRRRRDKTGSRTYTGVTPGSRRRTEFAIETYLVENAAPASGPAYGPLVESGMGGAPLAFNGATAGSGSSASQIEFGSPHGLVVGQAFGFNGELRFVESVDGASSVTVNAPFTAAPASGALLTAAATYPLADELPTAAVFDYWDPVTVVQRILPGAAVNTFEVRVNADYHELEFRGEAQDVLDSVTFFSGEGGLGAFPAEPAVTADSPPPIPGNIGQAWLGTPLTKFLSLASATVRLDNDLDFRVREFGSSVPQCVVPGVRTVTADIELFEADDEATRGLYAAARAQSGVGLMFQLGEESGQMLGVYLPRVDPEIPEFDDGERALSWRFSNARARGSANNEMYIAFG